MSAPMASWAHTTHRSAPKRRLGRFSARFTDVPNTQTDRHTDSTTCGMCSDACDPDYRPNKISVVGRRCKRHCFTANSSPANCEKKTSVRLFICVDLKSESKYVCDPLTSRCAGWYMYVRAGFCALNMLNLRITFSYLLFCSMAVTIKRCFVMLIGLHKGSLVTALDSLRIAVGQQSYATCSLPCASVTKQFLGSGESCGVRFKLHHFDLLWSLSICCGLNENQRLPVRMRGS